MRNYTKGKWMLAITGKNMLRDDKFEVVADIPHDDAMGHSEETPLCTIIQFNSNKEAEANGKLMAAAPEMLEALKGIEEFLVENYANGEDLLFTEFDRVQEAIKNATS